MKQLIIVLIITNSFSLNLFSQSNVAVILTEVEKNNTTLSALRKSVEADKLLNKTGIYLKNPEVVFNYLYGKPSSIGNRNDLTIRQTFDFPTSYKYKNQISDLKNEQAEFEYQKQRKSLLLQTQFVCYDLLHTNALMSELSKRLVQTQSVAASYKSKFDSGETNILEYNKAQLSLFNLNKEIELIDIERNALLSELTRLNGGIPISFPDIISPVPVIPVSFDQWYADVEQINPVLNWLKQEIVVSQKQESLNRAMSLPKVQTGYISETTVGQQFKGVTVGLTIPLWENKNMVKYSKAHTSALRGIEADNKLQFYNQLKALHTKVLELQKSVNDYRSKLPSFDNSELLKKSLDKGEIDLIDYILELSIYYESKKILLALERELYKTFAELNQYR
jgi:cobalt-zinc-cadmium efflux system outer membrane protein